MSKYTFKQDQPFGPPEPRPGHVYASGDNLVFILKSGLFLKVYNVCTEEMSYSVFEGFSPSNVLVDLVATPC